MGTITTYSHCYVKDGKAYEGSKEEIALQIAKYKIDENRQLFIQFNGYKEYGYHSYSDEYANQEIYKDVINFILAKSSSFGYRHYRNLNF